MIKPRKDWCSRWPDSHAGVYYGDCCEKHDYIYTVCKTWKERRKGDKELRGCVYQRLRAKIGDERAESWAGLIYLGVRGAGWFPFYFNRTLLGRKVDPIELARMVEKFGPV